MSTVSVATKIAPKTKEELETIARLEKRTLSTVVRIAIENYIDQYNDLHPRFRADILEALEGIKRGEVEPYAYG